MVHYYLTENEQLRELTSHQSGCWVSMVAPNEEELQLISKQCTLDVDVLRAALDTDERSRIDTDEGYSMVLVNIPTVEEQR